MRTPHPMHQAALHATGAALTVPVHAAHRPH
jgi:hypothetical protein